MKLADHACPECGKVLDAATFVGTDKKLPNPGDVSICFYCAGVHFYSDDLQLRLPTAEEWEELRQAKEVMVVVATIKTLRSML